MPAALFSSSLLSLPPALSLQKPTPSSSSSSSSSCSLLKLSSRSPPSYNIASFRRRSCASRRFYSPQGDRHPPPFPPLITADPEAKGDAWDPSRHEALLKGGEQVVSLLQEMLKLLEDMEMDEASEPMAVEIVAQGVIGKRVDEMESGFMMALDYMIQIADKDHDEQRKSILEVIKQTVLDHLTKKCPPHVIGLLCQTPQKESRHELLRRVAAGGGVFKSENGLKVQLPGANLNDIADQADDLLENMESRPTLPDRKLLARLVLVREEARNMMGGGLLDERNDRGLSTLPEAEVNFLSKLVALRPGKTVQKMISDVMHGKEEGADNLETGDDEVSDGRQKNLSGVAGRGSVTGRRPRPVRPGMFLETVSKVLGGIYAGNVSGITAQHLEWVHQKTLEILQEMAY
ncbi:uncharacterized protein LOC109723235 isoform X2 [Ananas comosus]|uniref:Uncharacterized protein LOC109723235 isoform X2 n=1 Tax=Ananas comosus TaxID=4615 RepID=A0A6P5GGQ4_ANACO|nr:uncharacterized protein LOC109723235 isoform X2 [Ananas comosus]